MHSYIMQSFPDFRWCQSRHGSLDAITCYALFTIFSDAGRDIQAQMHAFLMPTLIHYSTSRSETNFDTDGAITLTVINLVTLNLTSLCCLIYYLRWRCQIWCKLFASCSLPVRCLCFGGWVGWWNAIAWNAAASLVTLPYLTLPYLTLP